MNVMQTGAKDVGIRFLLQPDKKNLDEKKHSEWYKIPIEML
ncbi:hypothetical protein SAMN05444483_101444 [Salegentibacter echinorum]|uniref:Uncharacterized protein n=1 Tax=Salegentibacter echinorum TaxID=1073325 RepID=A0A1M5CBX6_SALEC|nr:hypothetical protein [Salegentibacter echinorum]SHF52200.1 hypothetical protein SAMN05444483_101444 [Salegentibacter echinorum]